MLINNITMSCFSTTITTQSLISKNFDIYVGFIQFIMDISRILTFVVQCNYELNLQL